MPNVYLAGFSPDGNITVPSVSAFGATAKEKLANVASSEPGDQLRAPFEQLLHDLAEIASLSVTR